MTNTIFFHSRGVLGAWTGTQYGLRMDWQRGWWGIGGSRCIQKKNEKGFRGVRERKWDRGNERSSQSRLGGRLHAGGRGEGRLLKGTPEWGQVLVLEGSRADLSGVLLVKVDMAAVVHFLQLRS